MPKNFLSNVLCKNLDLDLYPDLKAIKSYINFDSPQSTILEVGFGEGRIIDFFINNDFQGKIYGIENNHDFFDRMESKYSDNPQVCLYRGSVLDREICIRVEHSLMLWALFLEFTTSQKIEALKNMSKVTEQFIYVDILEQNSISNMCWIDKNTLYKKFDHGEYFGHIPDKKELYFIFKKAGLCVDKVIPYECKHQSKREIYVLEKVKC